MGGVTTSHDLKEKDKWGEVEVQEMCFYLENKFQANLGGVEAVPAPMDPAVYIQYRKEMTVYAKHTSEARRGYEARTYSPSTWACTNMTVDTAADPLAGLEGVPFTKLMQSQRYKKKVPSSKMFWK